MEPPAGEYVNLDADNIGDHHLCCALGDPKHAAGVDAKKSWLRKRFKEGLVFRKLDVRGKVFIEYMPSEYAWRPIVAPGWMTVHCLWVSGRYAGQGHARALLEYCIADCREKDRAGVVIAAAKTKRPFLQHGKFLEHLGFQEVDAVGEFRLYALPLKEDAESPRFASPVKVRDAADRSPMVLRHHAQCPFNLHWAPEMQAALSKNGVEATTEAVTTRRKAQKVASPLGAFGAEQEGELVTHFLHTEGAVRRLVEKKLG